MPGKRFNLTITHGPWKGQRARLVQQLNPESATMQLHSGTTITIPLAHFTYHRNKTPRPAARAKKPRRRTARRPSKRGRP